MATRRTLSNSIEQIEKELHLKPLKLYNLLEQLSRQLKDNQNKQANIQALISNGDNVNISIVNELISLQDTEKRLKRDINEINRQIDYNILKSLYAGDNYHERQLKEDKQIIVDNLQIFINQIISYYRKNGRTYTELMDALAEKTNIDNVINDYDDTQTSDIYKLQTYADKYDLYFKAYDKTKRLYKQNITNEKREQIDAIKKRLNRTANILLVNRLICKVLKK